MPIIYLIFLILINGCSSTRNNNLESDLVKDYKLNIDQNYSCSGKGKIMSNDYNTLSFKYKSKKDSSFIQFLDPLGRKALLMWITKNSIIARNLIENKQYNDLELKKFIPMMNLIEPNDLIRFTWGEKPKYDKRNKLIPLDIRKNSKLSFEKGTKSEYNIANYENKVLDQIVKIQIKTRNFSTDKVILNKFWKLLKY